MNNSEYDIISIIKNNDIQRLKTFIETHKNDILYYIDYNVLIFTIDLKNDEIINILLEIPDLITKNNYIDVLIKSIKNLNIKLIDILIHYINKDFNFNKIEDVIKTLYFTKNLEIRHKIINVLEKITDNIPFYIINVANIIGDIDVINYFSELNIHFNSDSKEQLLSAVIKSKNYQLICWMFDGITDEYLLNIHYDAFYDIFSRIILLNNIFLFNRFINLNQMENFIDVNTIYNVIKTENIIILKMLLDKILLGGIININELITNNIEEIYNYNNDNNDDNYNKETIQLFNEIIKTQNVKILTIILNIPNLNLLNIIWNDAIINDDDDDEQNNIYIFPLSVAIKTKNIEIINMILDSCNSIESGIMTFENQIVGYIADAINTGSLDIFKLILSRIENLRLYINGHHLFFIIKQNWKECGKKMFIYLKNKIDLINCLDILFTDNNEILNDITNIFLELLKDKTDILNNNQLNSCRNIYKLNAFKHNINTLNMILSLKCINFTTFFSQYLFNLSLDTKDIKLINRIINIQGINLQPLIDINIITKIIRFGDLQIMDMIFNIRNLDLNNLIQNTFKAHHHYIQNLPIYLDDINVLNRILQIQYIDFMYIIDTGRFYTNNLKVFNEIFLRFPIGDWKDETINLYGEYFINNQKLIINYVKYYEKSYGVKSFLRRLRVINNVLFKRLIYAFDTYKKLGQTTKYLYDDNGSIILDENEDPVTNVKKLSQDLPVEIISEYLNKYKKYKSKYLSLIKN
jgi:hypothetical protein